MDQALIGSLWVRVRRADAGTLAASFLPFPGLGECLSDFGLPPLPPLAVEPIASRDVGSVQPAFRNLSEDLVLALRRHAEAGTQAATVAAWGEKLLRFCEIRHHTLRARVLKTCANRGEAQRRMLHVAAFLMDQFACTGDLRLLNVVLKLADLKWVCKPEGLDKALAESANDVSALLQFRLILTTECALYRLRRDVAV